MFVSLRQVENDKLQLLIKPLYQVVFSLIIKVPYGNIGTDQLMAVSEPTAGDYTSA